MIVSLASCETSRKYYSELSHYGRLQTGKKTTGTKVTIPFAFVQNPKQERRKRSILVKYQAAKDRTKRAKRLETNKQHKTVTRTKSERKPPLRSIDCQYVAIEDALMEAGYYD